MENEVWIPVKDFPSYEVSNFARVKSTRVLINKKRTINNIKVNYLKPYSDGRYLNVRLYYNSLSKDIKLHHLVFFTFNPDIIRIPKFEVDHIKPDKTNCRLDNLQYISNRDNVIKSIDKSKTASKYIGVMFCKRTGRWRGQITHNNIAYSFKRRLTEEEAHKDYITALNRVNLGQSPVLDTA